MNKDQCTPLRVLVAFLGDEQPDRVVRLFQGPLERRPPVQALVLGSSSEEAIRRAGAAFRRQKIPVELLTAFLGTELSLGEQAREILNRVRETASKHYSEAEPWLLVEGFPVGLYEAVMSWFSPSIDPIPGVACPKPYRPSPDDREPRENPFQHRRPTEPLAWQDREFLVGLLDNEEREAVSQALTRPRSVLVTGERGTGKTLLARYIHYHCPGTAQGPFVEANFAALPRTLIEGELLGIGPNVATGVAERHGLLHHADRGTLLLDEIAETRRSTQAKLLRVISERMEPVSYQRVGETVNRLSTVRFIAATNVPLQKLDLRLRRDLRARFSIHIHLKQLYDKGDEPLPFYIQAMNHFAAIDLDWNPALVPVWDEKAIEEACRQGKMPGNLRDLHTFVTHVLDRRLSSDDPPERFVDRREIFAALVGWAAGGATLAAGLPGKGTGTDDRAEPVGVSVLRRILKSSEIPVAHSELSDFGESEVKELVFGIKRLALRVAEGYGGGNAAKARRVYGMSNPKSFKLLRNNPRRLHPDSPRRS